ncbi:MAG: hypothetical protein WAK76_15035, partial [Trebonia sp.]
VYSESADGSRRANSAMLTAQHTDATRAVRTTSGAADPCTHDDHQPAYHRAGRGHVTNAERGHPRRSDGPWEVRGSRTCPHGPASSLANG